MTFPNPNTISLRGRQRHGGTWLIRLGCILMGFVAIWIIVMFQTSSISVSGSTPSITFHVELPNEGAFVQTLKSCIPATNKKCMEFIPEGYEAQRIAILSPPGPTAQLLSDWIRHVIEKAHLEDSIVLQSSNVPPYGYGKTHGLTKIIRPVADSLTLGSADALLGFLSEQKHSSITLSELKAALRQIIRWHCRLSHVAAHTAELTIHYEEAAQASQDAAHKIVAFVSGRTEKLQRSTLPSFVPESPYRDARNLIESIQTGSGVNVMNALSVVLSDEMHQSKNLTTWPCHSFWSSSDGGSLTPIITRLAQSLSPNCTDELSSCFVKRDKCEAAGDAACRGVYLISGRLLSNPFQNFK